MRVTLTSIELTGPMRNAVGCGRRRLSPAPSMLPAPSARPSGSLQGQVSRLCSFSMGAQCAMAANSSLLGYLQSRLQTGMRGAFGKPQGTVARVHIGQVIMSIRTKLQNKEHVIEALCRAKFKFPGRQKIHISKKWGFTKFNADEFEDMVAEKRLIPDGCGVKYIPNRGPLDKWRALHS
ncbi:60S ribosomal protein L10-like [Canis lupus dingo]|uniref:60S ribosomal protein L10-like n=1 Tax=Canis lupus dingo TaxID=286419 RepID=UPI0020C54B89|nr:60S ribosomal protein L10-like [Canis lupus dingo]